MGVATILETVERAPRHFAKLFIGKTLLGGHIGLILHEFPKLREEGMLVLRVLVPVLHHEALVLVT